MGSMEEAEDHVVQEALARRLFVFQYPMRPRREGWDRWRATESGIKPVHRRVRLEFERDDDDRTRLAFDGGGPVGDPAGCAVAVLRDGGLHVTPLGGVMQMRPCLSRQDDREQTDRPADDSDSDGAGDARQITVSFARTETERGRRARERSYGFLSGRAEREPWCDSSWWPAGSERAALERERLLAPRDAPDGGEGPPPAEYLSALVPRGADEGPPGPADLAARCGAALVEAGAATVGWMAERTGASGAPLLAALAASGRLLSGGRWAARSSLLYPAGGVSRHSGAPAETMRRARDYVLYLFARGERVDRKRVGAAVRLPPEEVEEILSSVARRRPGVGWELPVPADPGFGERHPDAERRQAHFWEARQRQFNEMLSGEPAAGRRQRRRSRRESSGSANGNADEENDAKKGKRR